jgi:hypothetical protein
VAVAKMKATEAAVHVLEREGVTMTFGVPGAAINPNLCRDPATKYDPAHSGTPRRERGSHGGGRRTALAAMRGLTMGGRRLAMCPTPPLCNVLFGNG